LGRLLCNSQYLQHTSEWNVSVWSLLALHAAIVQCVSAFGLLCDLWSLSTRLILLFVGAAGTLEVSVKVSNTGSSDGEEVAQLYLRDVISSVTQPVLRSEKQFLSSPHF
jgi:hypothetical protein